MAESKIAKDYIKITDSKQVTIASNARTNIEFDNINVPSGYKIWTFVPITADAAFLVSNNGAFSDFSQNKIVISAYNCYSSSVTNYIGYDAICIKTS